ncbi:MAG: ectoine/hydroxyectoine ABC transporter substrate-binding protein EhuB [Actinomycetota bacterium]|nr:ectoine/hydroxyectoine ABC transporter substrate-binding protein EhuB [Actinomycetota bacterium]
MEGNRGRGSVSKGGRWLWALVSVVALAAAACGGGGAGTDTGAQGTIATTAAQGTAATTPTTAADGTTATTAAEGLLAELQERGVARIGIANEVPYGYEDESGNVTGEAPEVAKEVLSRLGIPEVEAVVVEFGALIPALQAGQFDMIAAGMFITPERAEQILFSDPDYCGATAFAVPEGNPLGLSDFQSVVESGAQLGVLSGAVEEGYALESGVPDANLSRFGDTPSLFDALQAGRIDAVALTDVTVATQVAALPGFESTPGFIPVIDGEEQLGCGGFGFMDEGFRDAFNEVLNEMQANDEIFPIVETFGFSKVAVEKAKELTVEDLTG